MTNLKLKIYIYIDTKKHFDVFIIEGENYGNFVFWEDQNGCFLF